MKRKKIAICHYRVGGTDGVSLEIAKRKTILEKYGCEVKLIAGNRSNGADYIINELEWDDGIIPILKENGFLHFNRHTLSDDELQREIDHVSNIIEDQLDHIQAQEQFDVVLTHNVFSFGGHIAAGKAFAHWIRKHSLHCIATHHDFYWERKQFQIPRNDCLREHMSLFMPPNIPTITHVVINSLAKRELKKRSGIDATVLPDIFNFDQPKWKKDNFNKDFLKHFDLKNDDLIILQATRVIPRKGIEIAIHYANKLQEQMTQLRGKRIYNGKVLSKDANAVLIIAGYAEDEDINYLYKLRIKVFEEKIHAKFTSSRIKAHREFINGSKTYSLWDAYVHADIVTFPSLWEGWGNQFIEAVFAKKPVVLYEYPVYKADIAKEGYKVISLGDKTSSRDEDNLITLSESNIQKTIDTSIQWLLDPDLNITLEENSLLGERYHSYKIIEDFLTQELKLKKDPEENES